MDFFEALRERAISKLNSWGGIVAGSPEAGRNATIEALRSMMVTEPIRGRSSHHITPHGEPWTSIWLHGTQERITISGHWGTDGEKVTVIVFRLS